MECGVVVLDTPLRFLCELLEMGSSLVAHGGESKDMWRI